MPKSKKKSVKVVPSYYRLRTTGNVPWGTKAINTVFNFGRKKLRDWFSLLQVKQRTSKRGVTKGYSNIANSNRKVTKRPFRFKKVVQSIDFQDDIWQHTTSSGKSIVVNQDYSYIYANGLVLSSEFSKFIQDHEMYKVVGVKLTYTPPVGTGMRYVSNDDASGYAGMEPAGYPTIGLQMTNGFRSDLANKLKINGYSTAFDPHKKGKQVKYFAFNNDFFIPKEENIWRKPTDIPFDTMYCPYIYFFPLLPPRSNPHSENTSYQFLGTMLTQYKIVGIKQDRETSDTPIGRRIGNEIVLNENLLPRSTPPVDALNYEEDGARMVNTGDTGLELKSDANEVTLPENACELRNIEQDTTKNHKLRRIKKRIDIRWNKIFDPDNCCSDIEEENEKENEAVNEASDEEKGKDKIDEGVIEKEQESVEFDSSKSVGRLGTN